VPRGSTEAEIRAILDGVVRPRVKLGSALAALVKPFGGLELDIKRDKKPAKPANLAAIFRAAPLEEHRITGTREFLLGDRSCFEVCSTKIDAYSVGRFSSTLNFKL
jgi:plasmid stability protein